MGQQLERSTHGEAPIDASIRLIQVGVSGLKIGWRFPNFFGVKSVAPL